MNYRSVADMNDVIVRNLYRFPRDIDLVVGVPRSGILAASLFSLASNIPMTDLDSFLDGRIYSSGFTKRHAGLDRALSEMRTILVIDDSVASGKAIRNARNRIAAAGIDGQFVFAAVFGSYLKQNDVDVVLEVVPHPRIFQWNFIHHKFLENSCVDIDGVLCVDPLIEENDDGHLYESFLLKARPLYLPTRTIGWLVTSRLEKYRSQTELWLAANNIRYKNLIMLDLPSKIERQKLGNHGAFKANIYRSVDAHLFIESEQRQASEIASISGKPVLCVETQMLTVPSLFSAPTIGDMARNLPSRLKNSRAARGSVKTILRAVLGERVYDSLKLRLRGSK